MVRETELHLHAFAKDDMYHIGWAAFVSQRSYNQLVPDTARDWNLLNKALQAEDS